MADVESSAAARDQNAGPTTSGYDDPSSKLWSIYVTEVAQYDKALVENWKKDMDAILIFSGLFSASVTAFIIESYKQLSADSGDITVTLLMQISQQLAAASNGTHTNALSPLRSFQPTSSTVRVNALLFLSLISALSCALAATLVQQWARNYLQGVKRRPAPHRQARIRAFLYEGIKRFRMTSVVESIPTLLHAAVFLFFAGVIEFLFPINHTIAYIAFVAVIFCALLYIIITILPTIFRNCPYQTPLSNMCWRLTQALRRLLFKLFSCQTWRYDSVRLPMSISAMHLMSKMSMVEDTEALATRHSHERDLRALQWAMESLIEDCELEPFVEGISTLLSGSNREKIGAGMSKTMLELLFDRRAKVLARTVRLLGTCEESAVLTKASRRRRAIVCMDAITSIFHALNRESSDAPPFPLPSIVQILGSEWADFARTVAKLQTDEVPDIVSSANSLAMLVVTNLHTAITTGWGHVSISSWSYVISALNILDSIDCVFDLLPTIAHSLEPSSMINSHPIIRLLRMKLLPLYLGKYSHPGSLSLENRQRCVMAYLKAIYVTACHFPCNGQFSRVFDSTTHSLVALRSDDMPSIAHYASCTTARLAYHLQCDIVYWLEWGPQYYAGLAPCLRALDQLQILRGLDRNMGKADLQRQLIPGHVYSNSSSQTGLGNRDNLHNISRKCTGTQPSGEILQLSPDELEQFKQEFQLCTTRGYITSDFPLSHKVYLSQGRIVILITFLQSIESSPLSGEPLKLTSNTIQLLTKNLTARYSSHTAQSLLVKLIGKVTSNIACHDSLDLLNEADHAEQVDEIITNDPHNSLTQMGLESADEHMSLTDRDLIMSIMQAHFNVLGTICDPDSIDDAKAIVQAVINDSAAPEPFRAAAANTLWALKTTIPFLLPLDFMEHAGQATLDASPQPKSA